MRTQWGPNSNSAEIFVHCTYPHCKFHHPMLTRSEVIALTNTQTNRRRWKHPTLFATLRRWVNTNVYADFDILIGFIYLAELVNKLVFRIQPTPWNCTFISQQPFHFLLSTEVTHYNSMLLAVVGLINSNYCICMWSDSDQNESTLQCSKCLIKLHTLEYDAQYLNLLNFKSN